MPLDLQPRHLLLVQEILRQHLPGREVWAFGSRTQGTARPFSDLDLVVLGDAPLPLSQRGALLDALSESNLPFKVDVVEWSTANAALRAALERQKVVVQVAN